MYQMMTELNDSGCNEAAESLMSPWCVRSETPQMLGWNEGYFDG